MKFFTADDFKIPLDCKLMSWPQAYQDMADAANAKRDEAMEEAADIMDHLMEGLEGQIWDPVAVKEWKQKYGIKE